MSLGRTVIYAYRHDMHGLRVTQKWPYFLLQWSKMVVCFIKATFSTVLACWHPLKAFLQTSQSFPCFLRIDLVCKRYSSFWINTSNFSSIRSLPPITFSISASNPAVSFSNYFIFTFSVMLFFSEGFCKNLDLILLSETPALEHLDPACSMSSSHRYYFIHPF